MAGVHKEGTGAGRAQASWGCTARAVLDLGMQQSPPPRDPQELVCRVCLAVGALCPALSLSMTTLKGALGRIPVASPHLSSGTQYY